MSTPSEIAAPERLAVLALTLPRFAGRATLLGRAANELRYSAGHGDVEITLSLLESISRDGLRVTAIRTIRGEVDADRAKALKLSLVAQAKRVRAERAADRGRDGDQLAARVPGNAVVRAVELAARDAIAAANFRTATHSHTQSITVVGSGECARSVSGQAWPGDVGLPNAYSFRVATSEHAYSVTTAILSIPRDQRVIDGVLYLSPVTRVRQGRGTSLVTERLATGKRGALVWL